MMEINLKTSKREELVDITNLINKNLKNIAIKKGVVHIFTPHSTCGLTLNENADPNIKTDILTFLNSKIKKGIWMHDKVDNNADAHIKTSIIGNSLIIPFKDKELKLGTWQNIFVCEFDGPKNRKVIINFIETK